MSPRIEPHPSADEGAREAPEAEPSVPEVEPSEAAIEALAELAPEPSAAESRPRVVAPGLRTASIESLGKGAAVTVLLRGRDVAMSARIAPEVDRELVERAFEEQQAALVEVDEGGEAFLVGVVQTRVPEKLVLRAEQVVIEGEREVLVRSGKSGLSLREDGEVELVGSRISATARGLFRLVGRMLRLN